MMSPRNRDKVYVAIALKVSQTRADMSGDRLQTLYFRGDSFSIFK